MNGDGRPPASLLGAFTAGLGDLTHPAFRGVALKTIGLSLLAYAVTGVVIWKGLGAIPTTGYGWIDVAIGILSGVGIVFVMAVVFPAVVSTFVGLFLDDVAEVVERRHYPADPPGRSLHILPGLLQSLRFLGIVLLVNLLALPFYIAFLFLPPLNIVLFYLLNGYLIGREYFDLVAMRHLPAAEAKALRRRHRWPVTLAGALAAFLFTLPLAALLAPLVVTAAFVHHFKRLTIPPRRAGT